MDPNQPQTPQPAPVQPEPMGQPVNPTHAATVTPPAPAPSQTPPPVMSEAKKSNSMVVLLILLFLAVAVVGGLYYFVIMNNPIPFLSTTVSPQEQVVISSPTIAPSPTPSLSAEEQEAESLDPGAVESETVDIQADVSTL